MQFAYELPADATGATLQLLDADGNVVAEYTLTRDPATGLWVGSGPAPGKGEYHVQLAYSTSTFALLTQEQGTVRSQSASVAGAVADHPGAVVAGTAGAAILSAAAVFVLRRRPF